MCQHQELLLATSFVPLAERSGEAFILIRLHRAPSSIHLPQLLGGEQEGDGGREGRPKLMNMNQNCLFGVSEDSSERRREVSGSCQRCYGGEESQKAVL